MIEKATQLNAFDWRLPLYAAVGTLLVFLPFALSSADLGEIFYVFVAAPVVSLVLIVFAVLRKGRRRQVTLSMLVVYWIVSATLVANYSAIRDTARWFLWANGYKAAVLRQPASENGEFKHTEWDGWGFVGADTVVYLVFDPNDSLRALTTHRPGGKSNGLSCDVSQIRRLESHWYAVTFFTDTSWGRCS
jgi:hypothetical protein